MISRRTALRALGACITLPLLDSQLAVRSAYAEPAATKKRFIGCFFGSGAPMPGAANGDWGYSGAAGGALKPLKDLGVDSQVSVLRGFRAVNNFDVHWSGTAGFLSGVPVGVSSTGASDPSYQRGAKTFDQCIADTDATSRIRSLHAGFSTLTSWDQGHDSAASINYVNAIAWRDAANPISNMTDCVQMFTRVFGAGGSVADAQMLYRLKRKQSILDGVLDQYKNHKASLSTASKLKLDAFAQSVREMEGELATMAKSTTCVRPDADANPDAYLRHFRTVHKIIIAAMQCNMTRSATIMYNDGIGPNQPTPAAAQQHDCAHGDWASLIKINQLQVGLWGELLVGLRAAGILSETVSILGSNMSDGKTHNSANIPLLIASANVSGELKLGQEIYGTSPATVTDVQQNRNLADLYVDLFKLYGVSRTFGADAYASTGKPSGVLT
jgi:hypothetical protein